MKTQKLETMESWVIHLPHGESIKRLENFINANIGIAIFIRLISVLLHVQE